MPIEILERLDAKELGITYEIYDRLRREKGDLRERNQSTSLWRENGERELYLRGQTRNEVNDLRQRFDDTIDTTEKYFAVYYQIKATTYMFQGRYS